MGRDELAKLGKDNCGEIAYRLEQYAFHITRTLNRNISRCNRLRQLLVQYSAGKLLKYDKYMPYEEKLACLINEDSYASKINDCRWQFQDRIDRLQDLDKSLTRLSGTIKSLSYNKVSNNG